jgi:hypothetical protein
VFATYEAVFAELAETEFATVPTIAEAETQLAVFALLEVLDKLEFSEKLDDNE